MAKSKKDICSDSENEEMEISFRNKVYTMYTDST